MKYVILACLDTRLDAFMPPQAVNDMLDEDIIESNRRAVLNGSIPAEKAERLIVYKIGTFDDTTGDIKPAKQKLCNLRDFVPRKTEVVEEAKPNGTEQTSN